MRITAPFVYPTLAVYPALLAVPTAYHATPQTVGSSSARVQCWNPTIFVNGRDKNEGWVTLPSVSISMSGDQHGTACP